MKKPIKPPYIPFGIIAELNKEHLQKKITNRESSLN